MYSPEISRRQFIATTAAIAGGIAISPLTAGAAGAARKTAADQGALGRTGLKLSRLGVGCGSNSGNVKRLIRSGFDQGLTYVDTCQWFQSHEWIRQAIQDLPREKFFIQTKMGGNPEKPLEVLDRFRQELGPDYIDSVLTHCTVTPDWDNERRRVMDALEEAKDKKIIGVHGVSCHSLPALALSARLDWVDVNLVRLNPQGAHLDTPALTWNATSNASHVLPVIAQIRRENGHGVIGMKLIGDGDFTEAADRRTAIRFAMQSGLTDAVVIGFKSTEEIDEAVKTINAALAVLT
jgi:predicted aldo/keto reductase-like oxidoreductase